MKILVEIVVVMSSVPPDAKIDQGRDVVNDPEIVTSHQVPLQPIESPQAPTTLRLLRVLKHVVVVTKRTPIEAVTVAADIEGHRQDSAAIGRLHSLEKQIL